MLPTLPTLPTLFYLRGLRPYMLKLVIILVEAPSIYCLPLFTLAPASELKKHKKY
jgi:hypothetical protein